MKIDGVNITKPALSEVERITFKHYLELEAFNTDGLRSLLQTMNHIKNMSENARTFALENFVLESLLFLTDKDKNMEIVFPC